MSLTVSGIIRIYDEPVEHAYNADRYFNFIGEGKHPYKKGGRWYYRVAIRCPEQHLAEARQELVKGASLWVRHGDLNGTMGGQDKNFIYSQVATSWINVTPLAVNLVPSTANANT